LKKISDGEAFIVLQARAARKSNSQIGLEAAVGPEAPNDRSADEAVVRCRCTERWASNVCSADEVAILLQTPNGWSRFRKSGRQTFQNRAAAGSCSKGSGFGCPMANDHDLEGGRSAESRIHFLQKRSNRSFGLPATGGALATLTPRRHKVGLAGDFCANEAATDIS